MSVITVSPSEDVASIVPRKGSRSRPLLDPPIVKRAITDALVKLNPRHMMKNPDFTALKDDFIPGEKVILYDDFTDMAPDEAPPHWKVRGNAVTLLASGALRQLNVGSRTTLTPSIKDYPKNFTLEQDMIWEPKGAQFYWDFFSAKDHRNQALRVDGGSAQDEIRIGASTAKESLFDTYIKVNWHAPIKHAIWVQNGRLRIYYNGQKVGDFNQLELPDFDYAYIDR